MALADYVHVKPEIHTPRLCLRPMNAGDVPSLREWMPDPSIYTYWGKGHIQNAQIDLSAFVHFNQLCNMYKNTPCFGEIFVQNANR